MLVRKKINESSGVYFITFTCARWLSLFELTNGYDAVYRWFDYLKSQGHHIVGYVIMPSHVHVMIAFRETKKLLNTIVTNGKRLMAYELVKRLAEQGNVAIFNQLSLWVNKTQRMENKKHEVFEPSFDWKCCYSVEFMKQKIEYIHQNPCKAGLSNLPEDYMHSSAKYYYTGIQGVSSVITYIELQDIGLTSSM